MQRIAALSERPAPVIFIALCLMLVAGMITCVYVSTPRCQEEEPLLGGVPEERDQTNGLSGEGEAKEPAAPDYAAFGVNELGMIPILMYHEIGPGSGEWCRTPDDFRADLQRLYDANYTLVDLSKLIDNHITVPAGRSPVVLTFDDGNGGQLRYLEQPDGTLSLDPDCAVAILLEFADRHPDFGLAATFFVYYPVPFRQGKYVGGKLRQLHALGFSIGNHTLDHADLSGFAAEGIQYQLAQMVVKTREYVPGCEIRSLALPYGELPVSSLRPLLLAGSHGDQTYRHEAVLMAGGNPCPAPNAVGFDLTHLPRIRGSQSELDRWLGYLEERPELRYVSDGDPGTVVYPQAAAGKLDRASLGDREAIEYEQTRDGPLDEAVGEDVQGHFSVPWPEPS